MSFYWQYPQIQRIIGLLLMVTNKMGGNYIINGILLSAVAKTITNHPQILTINWLLYNRQWQVYCSRWHRVFHITLW